MLLFLLGLVILVVGYFSYGRFVERIICPDERETPACACYDGVDYVKLPLWKNMLIQLLNIAGVGPVIGVILGIKFGAIAFLIIPIGNIIGGAVHDFVSGMMSIRNRGANLPALTKITMGTTYARFFSVFMTLLLLLVVAVFINIPANLLAGMVPGHALFWYMVAVIFLYYIAATLFPVDKIIGRFYPIFGGMLLVGTVAIFVALMWTGVHQPLLFTESAGFKEHMMSEPIIPVLFVTIACGIISGFHATQSPIIARTLESEYHGRRAFYGMMVMEGFIAMVWAAAALVVYNLFPEYMLKTPSFVLGQITTYFLGTKLGALTIAAVVILAVTSGDTAMRSMRLSLAEMLHIDQRGLHKRVLLCLPLIVIVCGLLWWSNKSAKSFGHLWNYFAWANQVMAASTLYAATIWLIAQRKTWWITVVPGVFMCFIVTTYILWVSPKNGGPVGFALPLVPSYIIGGVMAVVLAVAAYFRGLNLRHGRLAREAQKVTEEEDRDKPEISVDI
ncbi:MAG: carbon starvation CstA family protein [Victivallales bacterium]|nr:carbon starvation CstA family protein [Victivallales bacterium]